MEFKIQLTDKSINNLKKLVPDFKTHFLKGMRKAVLHTEAKIKKSFGSNDRPNVKTGYLRRSIQSGINKKGNDIEGWIGSNAKYAAIHEFGGTIKPVNGEYLTFFINNQFRKVKEVVIPERSFLRAGIQDNMPNIIDIIKKEIVDGLNK